VVAGGGLEVVLVGGGLVVVVGFVVVIPIAAESHLENCDIRLESIASQTSQPAESAGK
jgi:hypothetical protein